MPASTANTFRKNAYFSTLVFRIGVTNAKELNSTLLQTIYRGRDKDNDGIYRSNVRELGGWHSKINMHRLPEYAGLVNEIDKATRRMSKELGYDPDYPLKIGSMWSIINPVGSMNISHIHPGCLWSGVYYVQTPEKSGNIEFVDPRTTVLMNQARFKDKAKRPRDCWTKVNFTPRPGMMLIFPAWLYHAVRPNTAEESGDAANRVIVSFNLNQKKLSK